MNITVPMRARKSNRRMAPINFGLSLRRIRRPYRSPGRKRYVISLILFAVNITALTIGSVGIAIEQADARGPYPFQNYYGNYGRNQTNQNNTNRGSAKPQSSQTSTPPKSTSNSQSTKTVQPTQQTEVTPPTAQTTVQPTSPAKTTAVTQTTVPQKTETPTPVDTAPQAAATTAAQEKASTATPVTYTSQQISTETRNRLLALATSAVVSGVLIFIMSFFTFGNKPAKRTIPVYYSNSVREVSLS